MNYLVTMLDNEVEEYFVVYARSYEKAANMGVILSSKTGYTFISVEAIG